MFDGSCCGIPPEQSLTVIDWECFSFKPASSVISVARKPLTLAKTDSSDSSGLIRAVAARCGERRLSIDAAGRSFARESVCVGEADCVPWDWFLPPLGDCLGVFVTCRSTTELACPVSVSHAILKLPEIQIRKGDVHFTEPGYAYLAEKVAVEISSALSK